MNCHTSVNLSNTDSTYCTTSKSRDTVSIAVNTRFSCKTWSVLSVFYELPKFLFFVAFSWTSHHRPAPKIYVLFVKRLVLFEEIWIWFFKHIYRYLSYKKQYPGNNPTQSSPLEENNDFCYVWTAFSMLSGFEPAAVCFTPPSYKMTNNLNDYYWKRYVLYAHNLLLKGKVSREF